MPAAALIFCSLCYSFGNPTSVFNSADRDTAADRYCVVLEMVFLAVVAAGMP